MGPYFILLSLLVFLGCNSNPYSDQGLYTQNPRQTNVVPPVVAIESADIVEAIEGAELAIPVLGIVSSGTPLITVENLPAGAAYNTEKGKIIWTPGYTAGNEAGDPLSTSANYAVTVVLRSSTDLITVLQQKQVLIVVHDQPRGMTVSGLVPQAEFNEGTAYNQTFQINDLDFPNGPFTFSFGETAPAGVTVSPNRSKAGEFVLNYLPSFLVARIDNNTCYSVICLTVGWSLKIVNPHGTQLVVPFNWQIKDLRQDPVVEAPSIVKASDTNATFHIHVEDRNGEISPLVSFDATATGIVKVTQLSMSQVGLPSAFLQIEWTGNPSSVLGTTQTLHMNTCVYEAGKTETYCIKTPIKVNF